jgi:hypothetical protein
MWRPLGEPRAERRPAEPGSDHDDVHGIEPGHLRKCVAGPRPAPRARNNLATGNVLEHVTRRTLLIAVVTLAALVAVGAFAIAFSGDGGFPAAGSRQTVRAPIDGLDVLVLESSPPQYMLNIKAGLPSGCAQKHSHAVTRAGDTITVTVLNSMPTGNPICTMIYGSYELNINLGSDFASGSTYTVRVNDEVTTFKAQ